MIRHKILITGAGGVGTISIYEKLKKKYDFYFADCNVNNIHPRVPKKKCYSIPNANSKKFKKSINSLCKKLKISIVIPTVDEELEIFSKNFKDISLVPNYKFVRIFNNKFKTWNSLKKNNISQPELIPLDKINRKTIFPIIFKPIFGRGSKGIFLINNLSEYKHLINKNNFNKKKYICQQFIKGTEYSVQMVSDVKGKLIYVIPVKIIEKKGITIEAKVTKNNKIINFCKQFHEKYSPENIYNIQLLINKEDIYCIEVNPRVSTTHILTLYQKIDPIKIFIQKNYLKDKDFNLISLHLKRFHETYIKYT